MTDHTDLIAQLNNGWVARPKRWSGDTHHDFPYGNLDDKATDLLMEEAADALEAAQAEIEAVRKANIDCVNHFDALRIDYEAALARLAELTKQEPVGYLYDWVHRSSLGRGDATYTGFTKDKAHAEKHDNAIAIYAAAGASPVQPTDLQAENAKLITALAACRDTLPVPDAGSMVDNWYCTAMVDPLQVPEYVKACVENMNFHRDFYQRRVDLLQQWQSKMRDPERTICCDIIANGQTLPPENAGNRYAVQPSQGLQSVADALTIEQLNDKVERLMAVQPSQADAQDAARYRWLRPALTRGGNVEDSGELVAAFSHLTHTPTEPEFDAAIDAAINAKETDRG